MRDPHKSHPPSYPAVYLDIVHVTSDELVLVDAASPVQDVSRVGFHNGLPVLRCQVVEIDLDESIVGCIFVGPEYDE